MRTLKLRIYGRVQGVGFRSFALQVAIRHSLRGEVWNGTDRAVYCILQHDEGKPIDNVLDDLLRGPERVDGIDVSDISQTSNVQTYSDFLITPTRPG